MDERECYPIIVSHDQETDRWAAWIAVHETATQGELLAWLRANVPVQWTGEGVWLGLTASAAAAACLTATPATIGALAAV